MTPEEDVKEQFRKIKQLPAIYACYYPILCDVAREYGYCLALHGSLRRDFDLIAIPWVEDAKDPLEIAQAFAKAIGWDSEGGYVEKSMVEKPHGRRSYIIHSGVGYIDLCVMPRIEKKG